MRGIELTNEEGKEFFYAFTISLHMDTSLLITSKACFLVLKMQSSVNMCWQNAGRIHAVPCCAKNVSVNVVLALYQDKGPLQYQTTTLMGSMLSQIVIVPSASSWASQMVLV